MPEHEFVLVHQSYGEPDGAALPLIEQVRANPPAGCTAQVYDGNLSLDCRRAAPSLLAAIADTIAEVHTETGLILNDAGIEDPGEIVSDGPNGEGALIVAQLLLMAKARADQLGIPAADLAAFLGRLPNP